MSTQCPHRRGRNLPTGVGCGVKGAPANLYPGDVIETVQDGLAAVSSCMQEELERFKAFAECGQAAGTSIDNLPYQSFPS
jgi:hypothetical protein